MAPGSPPPPTLAALLVVLLVSARAGAGAGDGVAPAAPSALDQVCGRLGGYYVTPALCASALCGAADADPSAPCRAARDAPAVAALAARLAADNATAARASVDAAVSSSSSPAAAAALRSCLQLYDAGAVPALRWAARAVAAGRFRGAREVLQAAQYVAAWCQGMAGDAPAPAPAAALPRENAAFGDMALVAHAVVASMLSD